MPEITSVEIIRTKLREFEDRVEGAIMAANTLAHINADAGKLHAKIKSISTESEQSLQKTEGVLLQLLELQRDWETLKRQVDSSQTESRETREWLLSEVSTAIQSLGGKLNEAEERLDTTNRASLAEQADLLGNLDASTRENAGAAVNAQAAVRETASRLDALLATLREQLQDEVRTRLTNAEELLESEVQRVERYLKQEQNALLQSVGEQAANHERILREEMAAFRLTIQRSLLEQRQAIDVQLTIFLNKQNSLVENLTQRIDSYHGVTQALSAELAGIRAQFDGLNTAFNAHKTTATNDLAALATEDKNLRALVAGFQADFRNVSARIEETIQKLGRRSWLTGVK